MLHVVSFTATSKRSGVARRVSFTAVRALSDAARNVIGSTRTWFGAVLVPWRFILGPQSYIKY
jgi:hypothetical protein